MTDAPRWLDRDALARYIAVEKADLPKLVRARKLPAPSHHLGPKSPRWDRAKVDAMFTGEASSVHVRAAISAAAEAIAQGR